MKRINILGNSGSGKTMLARIIGERLRIPVVHLDTLFWEPGWQEADASIFRQRTAAAISGEAWVCEGNYAAKTFDLRVPQAHLNIWLDTPRLLCALRVILRSTGGRNRPDLPVGCEDAKLANTIGLVRDVWRFDAVRRGRVDAELARWTGTDTVLHLSGRQQIARFLAGL